MFPVITKHIKKTTNRNKHVSDDNVNDNDNVNVNESVYVNISESVFVNVNIDYNALSLNI